MAFHIIYGLLQRAVRVTPTINEAFRLRPGARRFQIANSGFRTASERFQNLTEKSSSRSKSLLVDNLVATQGENSRGEGTRNTRSRLL